MWNKLQATLQVQGHDLPSAEPCILKSLRKYAHHWGWNQDGAELLFFPCSASAVGTGWKPIKRLLLGWQENHRHFEVHGCIQPPSNSCRLEMGVLIFKFESGTITCTGVYLALWLSFTQNREGLKPLGAFSFLPYPSSLKGDAFNTWWRLKILCPVLFSKK